uniref:Negative elongation factor E n=2 Tax=Schistocephalus solidus TaxID=70667 RepID=A0A0X3NLG8_SCHSO
MLKQMRVYLNDLNQEANIQRVKEDTNKKVKNTEKAKEEAMKLLKSGAISFGNATEKHVFKRKARESDVFSGDVEDASGQQKSKKMNLYENFVYGERMQATSQLPTKLPSEPYLSDITSSADANRSEKFGRSPVSLDDQTTETQQTNKSSSRHAQESSSPSNHSYFKEDPYNRRRGGLTIYINCCDISESLIRQVLEPYGSIQRIRLDERKSYAFVTLSSPEEAEKALQLDRTMFDNRRLRVNYARRQFTYSNEGDLSHADRYRPSLRSCGPSRTAKSEAPPQETGSRNLVDYGDVDL